MKERLLLLSVLLISIASYSQDEKQRLNLDEKIQEIDESKITSNILLDKTIIWSGLKNFNKPDNPSKSSFNHFKQAWSDIERASYEFKSTKLNTIKESIDINDKENIAYVGIINTNVHSLNYDWDNPNSSENGLKLFNNKFITVEGKEPFNEHQVLIVSPLKSHIKSRTVSFAFDEKYWFNGPSKTIQSLSIVYKNSKIQTILDGKIVTRKANITFNTSGYKTIIFDVIFDDGTLQSTSAEMYVKIIDSARTADPLVEDFSGSKGYDAPNNLAFRGYSFDPNETSAINGHLDYRIFYDKVNNNKVLNKPIIIIDGFDPGDKRKIQDSDSSLPDDEHTSMEEFMTYTVDNNPNNRRSLLEEMRNDGFDVIFVNQPTYYRGARKIDGGADYIERNGLAHAGFYQHINAIVKQNGSNEKLVLAAPSMGGQMSRYGLAYLEKRGIPHNVRLWISIDSPHLGANIPLGAQAFVNMASSKGVDSASDFVNKDLGSVAAKQQLIEQYLNKSGRSDEVDSDYLDGRIVEQGYTYNQGSPYFKQFYKNLFNNGLAGSKGYPKLSRNIALVNGSLSSSRKYLNPFKQENQYVIGDYSFYGDNLLELKGFLKVINHHVASIETYNMSKKGLVRKKIARFKKSSDDNSMYATNINSRGVMDNVPGGWFPTQREIALSSTNQTPTQAAEYSYTTFSGSYNNILVFISKLLGSYWSTRRLNHSSSFISSFSALGHLSPDQNWSANLGSNLLCKNLTPFNSYYGENINTQHTSFNIKSVAWLKKELGTHQVAPSPQVPIYPVNPDNLVGSGEICQGATQTYTFASCSTPTQVKRWSWSSSYLAKVSHTSNSITVKASTDSRRQGWVEAEFYNGTKMRKNIWVGKPASPTSRISGPTTVRYASLVNYRGSSVAGATSLNWLLPYPFIVSSNISPTPRYWQIRSGANSVNMTALVGPKSGLVQFRGKNKCGYGGAKSLSVTVSSKGGGGGGVPRLEARRSEFLKSDSLDDSIYPNPVDNELHVRIADSNLNSISYLNFYDITGRKIYSVSGYFKMKTIDTSSFRDGVYVLVFTQGEKQISKKIVVKH